MALWLVRAGKAGEHEARFLEESRIYMTRSNLDFDVAPLKDKAACREALRIGREDWPEAALSNVLGQVYGFAHGMQRGDRIVLPSKFRPTLHFADVTGDYVYESGAPLPYRHWREVRWVKKDVPRERFDQDIRFSLGASQGVCRIERNDAEARVGAVLSGQVAAPSTRTVETEPDEASQRLDFEAIALDEIAETIIRRFKGYGLQDVVAGILRAQGYHVLVSPPGADKGVDLLASPGPLGFQEPRICVQVKSGNDAADSDTLLKLIGSMEHMRASHGLLVSWGGFKSSVMGDTQRKEFFRVRLWTRDDLVRHFLAEYERLDPDLRAEVPLKRVWTLALGEEG